MIEKKRRQLRGFLEHERRQIVVVARVRRFLDQPVVVRRRRRERRDAGDVAICVGCVQTRS